MSGGQARLDGELREDQFSRMKEFDLMKLALTEARDAEGRGEVPVGAVIINRQDGEILAQAGNRTEEFGDPTAHAELLAIRAATSGFGSSRLLNCDVYVTLEPCAMCAAAIALAKLRKLVFGAYDPKGGAVEHGPRLFSHSTIHHRPEIIGGVMETDCAELLTTFFRDRREKSNN